MAGDLFDRQRVPDERAETLWREFVVGEAVADGLGGSGGVCPRFVRDQWVAAQEKGMRASARARAAAEKALAPPRCASPAGTHLRVLTWNVWMNHACALEPRVRAIAKVVRTYAPHVVALQEVAHRIYDLLRAEPWWALAGYVECAPPPVGAPYFTVLLGKGA